MYLQYYYINSKLTKKGSFSFLFFLYKCKYFTKNAQYRIFIQLGFFSTWLLSSRDKFICKKYILYIYMPMRIWGTQTHSIIGTPSLPILARKLVPNELPPPKCKADGRGIVVKGQIEGLWSPPNRLYLSEQLIPICLLSMIVPNIEWSCT